MTTVTRALYFHGFASGPGSQKARAFRGAFEERGWSLEVPDLNPPDFRELTIGGMARRVEDLLEESPGPVVLIGSSLGAYLATLLASRLASVRALVMMAPAFDLSARWQDHLGAERLQQWEIDGTISLYHHGYQADRELSFRFYEEAREYPAYPEVGAVPTLVFHGRHDEIVPLEVVERFAAGTPAARLRIFEDDHSLLASVAAIVRESFEFLEPVLGGTAGQTGTRGAP